MMFFTHPADGQAFLVGSDHVPRIGEKLLCLGGKSNENGGLYLIEDVLYIAPADPGHQRVDVYGRRIGEAGISTTYASIMNVERPVA